MNQPQEKPQRQEFNQYIGAISSEIDHAQVRLVSAANVQMLLLYWKIGHFILLNQQRLGWGSKFIEQTSDALRKLNPNRKGYSARNLKYMCQFAKSYPLEVLNQFQIADQKLEVPTLEKTLSTLTVLDGFEFRQEPLAQIQQDNSHELLENEFGQEPPAQLQITEHESNIIGQEPLAQFDNVSEALTVITKHSITQIEDLFVNSPVARINWASHVALMNSKLSLGCAYWYMKQSVEFGWSSNVLKMQIDTDLFHRQIKSQKVSNFTATLPKPHSDLANYLLKDPYIFDLAGVSNQANERDIEEQLVSHVTKYLLEMGNSFAFVARQKHFQIGDSDFYADLILYNIKLHAYVVIELKATPFKPEYAGQLNFYVNVVDDKLRGEHDNKTIGLLLCKGKDEVMAQYALSGYNQALGVSDYQLSKAIPEELKSTLPSIEEVEEELNQLFNK